MSMCVCVCVNVYKSQVVREQFVMICVLRMVCECLSVYVCVSQSRGTSVGVCVFVYV